MFTNIWYFVTVVTPYHHAKNWSLWFITEFLKGHLHFSDLVFFGLIFRPRFLRPTFTANISATVIGRSEKFARMIDRPAMVKVVLKRRRGLPIRNPECHSHPGHPSETSPLLLYFEHEKSASVDSGVDGLLGITTALIVIMIIPTLRHTSEERLMAQELSTGSP